ncbi:hypothetical protein KGM_213748 [Danaus plexippus plexippus]|uniref:Uncharacterized protein n=1 Tax=Danaus plexippus plexippus TaxID=278856 RepID=A0A212F978_DANPL|nr:hypothetical protein KGM_213748 [Danaus plexippus plexippus]
MPSSDSDDFESADEGHSSPTKRERKKRLSSSNYSDNLESEDELKKVQPKVSSKLEVSEDKESVVNNEGWDDFDIDEDTIQTSSNNETEVKNISSKTETITVSETKDSGWDDFDDWGDDSEVKDQEVKPQTIRDNIAANQDVAQTTSQKDEPKASWGWGWGVDSLLNSATAGISTLTTQVSQGITTVLETGIGAPDPEVLARMSSKNDTGNVTEDRKTETIADTFQLGSLLSGVTKFVETTGTKVISGGLDTLETIGKKTMEVLQDGDPGLAKKKALLGLEEKPVLSQILREAKERADKEDSVKEAKREAKEIHYETLFDDCEGLVHLEALEMLSKQVSMRIEEKLRNSEPSKRQDIKETLQQVSELCEMPEEGEENDITEGISRPDGLHEKLLKATRDIGIKLQFQPLIKQYSDVLNELAPDASPRGSYKLGVKSLAHSTALSVEIYHKMAEMLLVKGRRSTADEADAVTQMTVVLTKHIGDLATHFTEKLSKIPCEGKEDVNSYITNIFLEAGNSSKYIENAFQLTVPIIQIGAV